MQLYALDENSAVICAKNASKHHNYLCLECQSSVRLRGGMHRQNHFYHVELKRSCRQNAKSMEHLHVQLMIESHLKTTCILEKRFDEIQRIADVFWAPYNIVFEIQCSPISLEEVKARNRDYATLGIQVIWILHEKRFNQSKLSAIEHYLQGSCFYYTNMNASGNGNVYDQFHIYHKGKKLFATRDFPIDVTTFYFSNHEPLQDIPETLLEKMETCRIYFKGDLIDYCYSNHFSKEFFDKAHLILNKIKPQALTHLEQLRFFLKRFILRPYKILFRIFLEKASF